MQAPSLFPTIHNSSGDPLETPQGPLGIARPHFAKYIGTHHGISPCISPTLIWARKWGLNVSLHESGWIDRARLPHSNSTHSCSLTPACHVILYFSWAVWHALWPTPCYCLKLVFCYAFWNLCVFNSMQAIAKTCDLHLPSVEWTAVEWTTTVSQRGSRTKVDTEYDQQRFSCKYVNYIMELWIRCI